MVCDSRCNPSKPTDRAGRLLFTKVLGQRTTRPSLLCPSLLSLPLFPRGPNVRLEQNSLLPERLLMLSMAAGAAASAAISRRAVGEGARGRNGRGVLGLGGIAWGFAGARHGHALDAPDPAVREADLDAARVVSPCQELGDDAGDGAAGRLVLLHNYVDARSGEDVCGGWDMGHGGREFKAAVGRDARTYDIR